MLKKRLLIFLLLLIPLVSATSNYNSGSLTMDLSISSEIDVMPESTSYSLDEVSAELYFFPKDHFGQEILSLEIKPEAEEIDDYLKFEWNNPSVTKLGFEINSKIKTINSYVKVKDRVDFPIKSIDSELLKYTKPSEKVDSDDNDIFRLANELAKGENDLYTVEFKLADWVKTNIEYDLSSVTANVAQESSWVLKTRQGVCDELTNLFIGLNRALGIPARFVSGVSFTNSELFEGGWGAHGWAEVYFPEYGWIPFDVTYGEFGFIDPTHIVLRAGVDVDESSTKYRWIGRKVEIKTNPINIDVSLDEKSGFVNDVVDIKVRVLNDAVKFGSYNLIIAKVKNLNDYYVATEFYLSTPKELSIRGKERINVLLEPNEEKEVYWKVEVTKNLDKDYFYRFPVTVYSLRNVSGKSSFKSANNDLKYDLDDIESYLEDRESEKENIFSKEISLECDADKDEIQYDETTEVYCYAKNTGNVLLENLDVCMVDDCQKTSLGIGEEKQFDFIFEPDKTGALEVKVKASNSEAAKTIYLEIYVHDQARIEILDLDYLEKVSFEDNYKLSFLLNKHSNTVPKNVKVTLYQSGFGKEWVLDRLDSSKKFEINMKGSDLSIGKNEINVNVEYFGNGKGYFASKSALIILNNVTFIQRVQIFFSDIAKFFGRIVG